MRKMNLTYYLVAIAMLSLGVWSSCTDSVDESNMYTFTGQTVADYLESQSELSDISYIVSKVRLSNRSESTLSQLLSTRGNYTVFAPTNDAVQYYLDSIYWPNFPIENIPDSTAEYLAKSCIIDNGQNDAYLSTDFVSTGALDDRNLNDRFIVIDFDTVNSSILVNSTSKILEKDIEVENGVIHKINKVLSPSNADLFSLMSNIDNVQIFTKLLEVTGWSKNLQRYRTEDYQGYDTYEDYYLTSPSVPTLSTESLTPIIPSHRNYGFVAFVEPDDLLISKWNLNVTVGSDGKIQNINDLLAVIGDKCKEYYPDATSSDLTSEDNAVNQFVAYHLLDRALAYNKMVVQYNQIGVAYTEPERLSINAWDYYPTMGKQRRLMKITEGATTDGKRINRHCTYNLGNYSEENVDCPGILIYPNNGTRENTALNGYYYLISDVLVYDNDVPNLVLNERMRYDVASLFPELATNGIRRISSNVNYYFPPDYFDNMTYTSDSKPYYLSGYGRGWQNYQGDEFNVVGQYDLTITLPPVPYDGTYELRLGYSINDMRGMAQIYVGENKNNLPAYGLPIDLRLKTTNAAIGWEEDTDDDEYNLQLDKTLRNHGYMKSPLYFGYESKSGVSESLRNGSGLIRKILWTGNMESDKTYYMRIKSVLENTNTQLHLDYIEVVPRSVYNGATAEDRW